MKRFSLKRLLKKRNNGGFTLVEVVISCALLGILVVGVCMFATPVMNAVSRGKASARATMLTETLDSYIAGILKNAKYVEILQYTTLEQANNGLKGSTDPDKGLGKIIEFMTNDPKAADYEVRCLGISWINDTRAPGKRKLMLTNNTVDAANDYKITGVSKVFDDVIYNQLYPIIALETFGVITETASTSTSTPAPAPASTTKVGGYKISIVVYSDEKCYNAASDDARHQSKSAFRSASFVKCLNMSGEASDICVLATDLQNAITTSKELNYPSSAVPTASTGTLKYSDSDNEYYYPDTYIYYVVPKKAMP